MIKDFIPEFKECQSLKQYIIGLKKSLTFHT